jgi:hypothetical protein
MTIRDLQRMAVEANEPVDYDALAFEAMLSEVERQQGQEADEFFVRYLETDWN